MKEFIYDYSYKRSFLCNLKIKNKYFHFVFQKIFMDWMENLLSKIKKEWIQTVIFVIYLMLALAAMSAVSILIVGPKWGSLGQLLLTFLLMILYFTSSKRADREYSHFEDLYIDEIEVYVELIYSDGHSEKKLHIDEKYKIIKEYCLNKNKNINVIISNLFIVHENQCSSYLTSFIKSLKDDRENNKHQESHDPFDEDWTL